MTACNSGTVGVGNDVREKRSIPERRCKKKNVRNMYETCALNEHPAYHDTARVRVWNDDACKAKINTHVREVAQRKAAGWCATKDMQ